MKRIILCFAIGAVTISATAKKKSNSNQKFDPQTMIKSPIDSLSYAFGLNIAQGLKDYVATLDIYTDSAKIEAKYNADIEKADGKQKSKLEKAKDNELASIQKNNDASFNRFLQGLEEGINASTQNSYNLGLGISSQLNDVAKKFSAEILETEDGINKEAFFSAVSGTLKEEKPAMENATEYLQSVATKKQEEMQAKKQEELKAISAKQVEEGAKFLADNKTKDGVVTLASGLQYKINTAGTGVKPTETDMVTVHYAGRLLDGSEFDSSIKRGEPATFGVTQVIKGWTEALKLMPVGSKWTVYIPYDLAYGEADMGQIKPFSTLIFEIELIDIAK